MKTVRFISFAVLMVVCLSCSKVTWTPYDYSEPSTPEVKPADRSIEARLIDATSSTLTIQWSVSSFMDAALDSRTSWKVGLYRDAATTQAVAEWDCAPGLFREKGSSLRFNTPCFFFSGLEPGTIWYFKAESKDCSGVFPFETTPFTCKIPDAVPAKPGDLLLGEDFSEMTWGPHYLISSVGYAPFFPDRISRNTPLDPASARNDYYLRTDVFLLPWNTYRETTRLADWDLMPAQAYRILDETMVCHTSVGLHIYGGIQSAIVLPFLTALMTPHTLRIRIKTSKQSDDADFWIYTTTDSSYQPDPSGFSPGMTQRSPLKKVGEEGRWSSFETVVQNMIAEDRIGISCSNAEYVLKEISVEVVE